MSTGYVEDDTEEDRAALDLVWPSILAACEGLHMSLSGAADPITHSTAAQIARGLELRLERWSDPTSPYDARVRELVKGTLNEWRERGMRLAGVESRRPG